MAKRSFLFAAAALLLSQTGCLIGPRTAGDLARVAVATAVVATHVAILAHHDAHYHYHGCGHPHRWHDGRAVFYYGGHWEYYDHHHGAWYYYVD